MMHTIPVLVALSAPAGRGIDLWRMAVETFPGMTFWVLAALALASVISWYIIGYKWFFLRRATRQADRFLDAFWQSKRMDQIYSMAETMPHSPTAQVFRAGYVELSKLRGSEAQAGEGMQERLGDMENVGRALNRAITEEMTKLESMVPFLATTGSAAPFAGLFGTVWGIMHAFAAIGTAKSAAITVIAPGMAEALTTTAVGLLAAIPAVVAYNYFVQRIKLINTDMETFANDFLNIVKRHFLK